MPLSHWTLPLVPWLGSCERWTVGFLCNTGHTTQTPIPGARYYCLVLRPEQPYLFHYTSTFLLGSVHEAQNMGERFSN